MLFHQEDIAILNVNPPSMWSSWNTWPTKHTKQTVRELKGEIDKYIIILGELNSLVLTITELLKQKISKDIEELNNTINQQNLINIQYLTTIEHTFLSTHRTFTKQTISLAIKQTSTNLKEFKSDREYSLTIMKSN